MIRKFPGVLILLVLCLLSCKNKGPEKTILYLCTNNNDLYSFDLKSNKLRWRVEGNNENTLISYFSIKGDKLIKAYLDRRISQIDTRTGKIDWTYTDQLSPNHADYHYDFNDIRFALFSQYPVLYKQAMIFANTQGELKSVDLKTKKVNWTYQISIPINFSPKMLNNLVVLNLGYRIITVDPETGKAVKLLDFEIPLPGETVIDDQHIHVSDEHGNAYMLDSNLNKIWTYNTADAEGGGSMAAVGEKQVVYGYRSVVSLDKKTGNELWRKVLPNEARAISTEIIGDIVSVNTQNDIYLLDADDGKILNEKHFPKRDIVGMMRYNNGFYYYLCSDHTLYKIDEDLKEETAVYKAITVPADMGLEDAYLKFN